MKKAFFSAFALSLSLVVFAGGKQDEPPDWVLNYQSVYPDTTYIAQEGRGKSADEARSNAASNLSFYFETSVNARREVNFRSFESGDAGRTRQTTEQSVVRETEVATSTSLSAVEFTEPWRDRRARTWHCIAFIVRETVWTQYEPTLRVAKDNFKGFYERAMASAEPFEKIRLLGMARAQGEDFLNKVSYAQFLSERLTDQNYRSDIALLSDLNSIQQAEKNKTPVFVEVQNDAGGAVYATVTKILSNEGFIVTRDRGGAVYVARVGLNFERRGDPSGLFVYSPSVQIVLSGRSGNVYLYAKDCGQAKAYTEARGVERCVQLVNDELNASFKEDFASALRGENS